MKTSAAMLWGFLCAFLLGSPLAAGAQGPPTSAAPDLLKDRGPGLATSLFGVYVRPGELLVYPSFEHFLNRGFQYSPKEFGVASGTDFLGEYRSSEGMIFLGYGLTDSLAVGLELSTIKASFRKSADDTSALPAKVRESGLGEAHAELTWRWLEESAHRPEIFVFTEVSFPHDGKKRLTGTADWLLLPGVGLVRGFRWGTLEARASIEYDFASAGALDFGEWSVAYLRQVSPSWRVAAGFEGQIGGSDNLDEVWFIADVQWHLNPHVSLRLHNGLGLTTQASGWAPEIGVLIRLPRR